MSYRSSNPQKTFIGVVAHYIHYLKYLDKLYNLLLKENIEMVYLIRKDLQMEEYCLHNNRKYFILDFKGSILIQILIKPLILYNLRRKSKKIIKNCNLKLILLTFDTGIYFDLIIKTAKHLKILTLILQCAIIGPEEYYTKFRARHRQKYLEDRKTYKIIIIKLITKFFYVIYFPILSLLDMNPKYRPSWGQGVADYAGVINNYSNNLLIKQRVLKKKIKILGLLHYDDAMGAKKLNINNLRKKYGIKDPKAITIVYFSQPFYTRNIIILTLDEQLNYVNNIIKIIDNFYTKKGKIYNLIIKLHPAEDTNDYRKFFHKKNIKIIFEANNIELIRISDFCISHHSTVIQSVIVMKKPILSLNILNLESISVGSNVIGIKKTINSWQELRDNLKILEKNNYAPLNNVNYDMVINDGKCYERTIKLIKTLINKTKKRANMI